MSWEALGDPPELKPCPFCGQPLNVRWRKINPKASCTTPGCWGSKLPVLQLDIPEFVAAWNTCSIQRNVGDLAMLVTQLVRALRKAAPEHDLPARAMDYLRREGFCGSPLRECASDPASRMEPDLRRD